MGIAKKSLALRDNDKLNVPLYQYQKNSHTATLDSTSIQTNYFS